MLPAADSGDRSSPSGDTNSAANRHQRRPTADKVSPILQCTLSHAAQSDGWSHSASRVFKTRKTFFWLFKWLSTSEIMVETSGFRLFPRSESIACIMFTGILHIWCMINALEAPGIAISLLSHSHYYNLMYFCVEIGMISDCL